MSKYDSLHSYLKAQTSPCRMSFAEINRIVGGLPASATSYRQWWENETNGSHVQARSWMNAGFRVIEVDLGRCVTFERIA